VIFLRFQGASKTNPESFFPLLSWTLQRPLANSFLFHFYKPPIEGDTFSTPLLLSVLLVSFPLEIDISFFEKSFSNFRRRFFSRLILPFSRIAFQVFTKQKIRHFGIPFFLPFLGSLETKPGCFYCRLF
jgi:hypothetical protein